MLTGQKYAAQYTPLSQEAARMALEEAVFAILGHHLSKSALCVLMAQSSLETGGFQKVPNYNFGGLKAYGATDYAEWGTKEGYGDGETHITARFRAYPDALSGAKDYVSLLAKVPRYQDAWKALEAGDPVNFAFALGKAGYFTADPAVYAKGVSRRWSVCALGMLGYDGEKPEGVKAFQVAHPPLATDGLIGPATRTALREALGG
jgi:hypothetical protein